MRIKIILAALFCLLVQIQAVCAGNSDLHYIDSIFKSQNSDSIKGMRLIEPCFNKALTADASCLTYCNKLYAFLEPKKEAWAYNELSMVYVSFGTYYLYVGNTDSAEYFYTKCLTLGQEKKLPKIITKGYMNLDNLYNSKNDYKTAIELSLKALDNSIDEKMTASIYGNLANSYIHW